MRTKKRKNSAGLIVALSMAISLAFGSIGMQARAEEGESPSADKITGVVTFDPTVTYYDMQGNEVTSVNAGDEVYIEISYTTTGIPDEVLYSTTYEVGYSSEVGRTDLSWKGNDSEPLPSWYKGTSGGLWKLWISPGMQASQIHMIITMHIPTEEFVEGWTPQSEQEGGFYYREFSIDKVVGPLTINVGTEGEEEPIGLIINNSKVFYYDVQGNAITSANPGDVVYATTTWEVEGGARGLFINSAFGSTTSGKEAALEYVGYSQYPVWVPNDVFGLWKITISKDISTPKLECAVHARLSEKNIDFTWPPEGQRGWWTENNFGKEFWIDNAEKFYLTINGVTGNDSSPVWKQEIIQGTTPSEPIAEGVTSNRVQIADGTTLESTVGGVYAANSVNGIAVTTEYAAVASAAGLSAEQIAAGTNVRFYFCDSYNKAAKEMLRGVAESSGKQVAAYLNADLYTISKAGAVTSVRQTSDSVNLVFGIPNTFVGEGHAFSLILIKPNGETAVLNDLDNDPNTITVETQFFGAYVLVY